MIFPFIDLQVSTTAEQATEPPLFKEFAWDYDNDCPLLKDGKTVIVEGLEAVKAWAYHVLKTQRYRYLAFSWSYGHELENLIGSTFSENAKRAEVKRYLEEALLNSYITGIEGVEIESTSDEVKTSFTAVTIYGAVIINV